MKSIIKRLRLHDSLFLRSALRVDHAGEKGAVLIYKGQYKCFRGDAQNRDKIEKMLQQEKLHLEFFENELKVRHIGPTPFLKIWEICAFIGGALSAATKREMEMTAAVEDEIIRHYDLQKEYLDDNSNLKKVIAKFRDEEEEHGNEAKACLSNFQKDIFYIFCRSICKIAIVLSKI